MGMTTPMRSRMSATEVRKNIPDPWSRRVGFLAELIKRDPLYSRVARLIEKRRRETKPSGVAWVVSDQKLSGLKPQRRSGATLTYKAARRQILELRRKYDLP